MGRKTDTDIVGNIEDCDGREYKEAPAAFQSFKTKKKKTCYVYRDRARAPYISIKSNSKPSFSLYNL